MAREFKLYTVSCLIHRGLDASMSILTVKGDIDPTEATRKAHQYIEDKYPDYVVASDLCVEISLDLMKEVVRENEEMLVEVKPATGLRQIMINQLTAMLFGLEKSEDCPYEFEIVSKVLSIEPNKRAMFLATLQDEELAAMLESASRASQAWAMYEFEV